MHLCHERPENSDDVAVVYALRISNNLYRSHAMSSYDIEKKTHAPTYIPSAGDTRITVRQSRYA